MECSTLWLSQDVENEAMKQHIGLAYNSYDSSNARAMAIVVVVVEIGVFVSECETPPGPVETPTYPSVSTIVEIRLKRC